DPVPRRVHGEGQGRLGGGGTGPGDPLGQQHQAVAQAKETLDGDNDGGQPDGKRRPRGRGRVGDRVGGLSGHGAGLRGRGGVPITPAGGRADKAPSGRTRASRYNNTRAREEPPCRSSSPRRARTTPPCLTPSL